MGEIIRGTILGGTASVCVIKSDDIVNSAIRRFRLAPTAAAALGRLLTMTAVLSSGLKSDKGSLTVSVNGGGIIGRMVCCGDSALNIRGYAENPNAHLPPRADGKLDVGGVVGDDGYLSITTDLGLKEPEVSRTALLSGEIGDDFAVYFAESLQIPSVVSVGALIGKNGSCISAGGVVIQLLPFAPESTVEQAERLVSKVKGVSDALRGVTAGELASELFGDLGLEVLARQKPRFRCKCSAAKMRAATRTMPEAERREIIEKEGAIRVICRFCGRTLEVKD